MKDIVNFALYGVSIVLLITLAVVFCLGWFRQKMQAYLTTVYSVKDPNGVEDLCAVSINGIDQYLHIRGRHCDNPILLFLHGGPGLPHIGWFDAIQRPWEDFFTVVQWDQRQVGKSYGSMKDVGVGMNNQRLLDDAESVVCYLRERFSQAKIVIMGWSNGTCLGMHLAHRHPEWFYAYVGVGQVVNRIDMVNIEYKLLLQHAIESDDEASIKQLKSISPRLDMENKSLSRMRHAGLVNELLARLGKGAARYLNNQQLFSLITLPKFFSPHITLRDLFNARYGDKSADLYPESSWGEELMEVDLPKDIGSSFQVPIIFFTGCHDWHVPYQLTDQWFQKIEAPHKEQVWFKESAHMPYIDEPGRFLKALTDQVLPLIHQYSER